MRYEKGRKDTTRSRILEVAAERFRQDGIAATGLARVMKDAGLTNGAFYLHFQSKADLVRDSVATAMEGQGKVVEQALDAGGADLAIQTYLSAEHRDNPGAGCALSALLPELARDTAETRTTYAEQFQGLINRIAAALPPQTKDPEAVAMGVYATLIGTLQLARATQGRDLSDRILSAGAEAARGMIRQAQLEGAGPKS